MRVPVLRVGWVSLLATLVVHGDVLFRDDFETVREGWTERIQGEAEMALVAGGWDGRCLRTVSRGGLCYYTRDLDPDVVRGQTLTVACWVKPAGVTQGPRVYSTAKLHIVQFVPDGRPRNHATRFVGTQDWSLQTLEAQIDPKAERVVLDLGIQNGTGEAWFDSLVVRDGRRPQQDLDLLPAATTGRSDAVAGDGRGGFLDRGPLDLRALPVGEQRWAGVRFVVPAPGRNDGRHTLVLRGVDTPGRPDTTPKPVVWGDWARQIALLCAAYAETPRADALCASMEVHYEDGQIVRVPLRFGRDVGSFVDPVSTETWEVVWRDDASPSGRSVGLGVFRWTNPRPAAPIERLEWTHAGAGPALIVSAVTAIRQDVPASGP